MLLKQIYKTYFSN